MFCLRPYWAPLQAGRLSMLQLLTRLIDSGPANAPVNVVSQLSDGLCSCMGRTHCRR